jgi:hypothetical protein
VEASAVVEAVHRPGPLDRARPETRPEEPDQTELGVAALEELASEAVEGDSRLRPAVQYQIGSAA